MPADQNLGPERSGRHLNDRKEMVQPDQQQAAGRETAIAAQLAHENLGLLTGHQIISVEPGARFNRNLSAYTSCFTHSSIGRQTARFHAIYLRIEFSALVQWRWQTEPVPNFR